MGASSTRIPVDPVEGLHVLGFPVAGLAFLIVRLGIGARLSRERSGGSRDGRSCAERAQKLTAADGRLGGFLHCCTLRFGVASRLYDGSAKASVSMSINTRP